MKAELFRVHLYAQHTDDMLSIHLGLPTDPPGEGRGVTIFYRPMKARKAALSALKSDSGSSAIREVKRAALTILA